MIVIPGISLGSPPRVRGTDLYATDATLNNGITPACAGNSVSIFSLALFIKDHPRVCGEQLTAYYILSLITGSPPRVRGTAASPVVTVPTSRITPACAGNRIFLALALYVFGDHPRVCGEQKIQPVLLALQIGSPPRVRGTDLYATDATLNNGITPACAGNSVSIFSLALFIKDHPRVCGEQLTAYYILSLITGSPPRVRGTAASPVVTVPTSRITPACAGNSHPLCQRHTQDQDHPRVCGEQSLPLLGG